MNEPVEVKQVIVMRVKYPNSSGGIKTIGKGKMVAQGSHASMSFMTRRMQEMIIPVWTKPELDWMSGIFAKIVCKVQTEDDLMAVYNEAKEAGLEVHLITDAGRTEFNEPTVTCLAIGPDLSSNIDPITKDLQLMN